MTISAVLLLLSGGLLLFAPEEVAGWLGAGVGAGTPVSLLGAALLGFAAMNWIARGSLLGGIYGKAVVAANQVHLTVGAVLLVKHALGPGNVSPVYWALTGLYVLGAGWFGYLSLRSPVSDARP